jgi:hypothetical protein
MLALRHSPKVRRLSQPSTFIGCAHIRQALYLADKIGEQRRRIVFSPYES